MDLLDPAITKCIGAPLETRVTPSNPFSSLHKADQVGHQVQRFDRRPETDRTSARIHNIAHADGNSGQSLVVDDGSPDADILYRNSAIEQAVQNRTWSRLEESLGGFRLVPQPYRIVSAVLMLPVRARSRPRSICSAHPSRPGEDRPAPFP